MTEQSDDARDIFMSTGQQHQIAMPEHPRTHLTRYYLLQRTVQACVRVSMHVHRKSYSSILHDTNTGAQCVSVCLLTHVYDMAQQTGYHENLSS